jgi:hypothetical protein
VIRARTDLLAGALAACGLLPIAAARAEPLHASLVVTRAEGAEDCPDTAGVAARVRRITGMDVVQAVGDEPHETWVQVELVRVLSGYRAVISARGRRQGTRSIEDVGPGCSSLADAVAITLVMLLDPDVSREREAIRVRAPVPGRSLSSSPAPMQPAAPREPKSARAASELGLGGEASAGASVAVLSHPGPLIEAGARLRVGSIWAFASGGGLLLPDRVAAPGGSVELELVYGYLRACATVVDGFALCLSPFFGSLAGTGRNYDDYDTRRLLWVAAAAAAELRAPLSASVFWHARATALLPLLRHGFSVDGGAGTTRAFRTPLVGAMLALGISAEL